MARARNIKPSFFQNEELGSLEPIVRLAFIGLWTIADFKGCIEWRPKRIKVQILPYDVCNLDKIGTTLDKSGLIRYYSVQGKTYIKIVNFEKHQNPHKNEKEAGSDLPDYNEINRIENIEKNLEQDGTTRADSLLLNPDSLLLNPDKKPLAQNEPFERFWSCYPKKRGKDKAIKAWKKLNPPLDDILSALHWQVKSYDWTKDGGQFIPYPEAYLNGGRWKDEPKDFVPNKTKTEAHLDFVNQVFGRNHGNERQIIDITPPGADQSGGENIPKIIDGLWKSGN
jgi:hypothetical protein